MKCTHTNFKHKKGDNIFFCFDCNKEFKLDTRKADCGHIVPPLKIFKYKKQKLCESCYTNKIYGVPNNRSWFQ